MTSTDLPLPGRAPLSRWLAQIAIAAAAAIALAIPLTLGVIGINYAATFIDRAPIQKHIKEAFDGGELDANLEAPVGLRGVHQYNDCLILHMALRSGENHWQQALGPFGTGDALNPCQSLKDLVSTLTQPPPPPEADAYTRYMHGHTALAAVLASLMPISTMRLLLSRTALLVVFGLLAASIWRIGRGVKRGSLAVAAPAAFAAVASAAFMLLFGFPGFSMSLNHFPEDMVVLAYLWFALFADFQKMPRWALIVSHAVFGVLTAWFEFLSGGLPLGACMILYMFAARAAGPQAWSVLERTLVSLAAFGAAFIAAYAFKLGLAAAAFDSVWASFTEGLTHRIAGGAGGDMGEAPPSVFGMIRALLDHADVVGAGWRELGRLLIAVSFVGFGYAAFIVWRRKPSLEQLIQPGLIASAFLVICGWHVVFYPHSTLHAFFMARTLVALYFTSILLVASVHRDDLRKFFASAATLPAG